MLLESAKRLLGSTKTRLGESKKLLYRAQRPLGSAQKGLPGVQKTPGDFRWLLRPTDWATAGYQATEKKHNESVEEPFA
jgi:hypothetical protein